MALLIAFNQGKEGGEVLPYIWGVSPLCSLRGCGVVAVEDTEEGAAEPVGRQRARPQLCSRFSASEGAVQDHQVGRSPQGEAWALPHTVPAKLGVASREDPKDSTCAA